MIALILLVRAVSLFAAGFWLGWGACEFIDKRTKRTFARLSLAIIATVFLNICFIQNTVVP